MCYRDKIIRENTRSEGLVVRVLLVNYRGMDRTG